MSDDRKRVLTNYPIDLLNELEHELERKYYRQIAPSRQRILIRALAAYVALLRLENDADGL